MGEVEVRLDDREEEEGQDLVSSRAAVRCRDDCRHLCQRQLRLVVGRGDPLGGGDGGVRGVMGIYHVVLIVVYWSMVVAVPAAIAKHQLVRVGN